MACHLHVVARLLQHAEDGATATAGVMTTATAGVMTTATAGRASSMEAAFTDLLQDEEAQVGVSYYF